MVQLKRNLLSVALASATMMLTAQAHAQTAQPADQTGEEVAAAKKKADEAKTLDKVVVTGIRGALERAIDTKQESTSIIEAVSAEDIGKLPDQSIADSIARLPGLTAQRKDGRASQINIRGFAGDLAATTLNGREQATTFDNRGVEFDQYPSELLSSVVVYKTPDARLVGQGLSGTVDLRTVRPLDYDKRIVNFGARYDQNKIRGMKENGYRYNASYIDQFLDNTLGVSIGFAHMDSPQPGFENEPWGYTGFRGDPSKQIIGGTKFFKYSRDTKRDGVMATVQFRPNDFYEGTLDLLYSHFKKNETRAGAQFWTEWGGGTSVLPGWTANGGTVTESSWAGVYPVISMDSTPVDNRLHSYGFNNRFALSENWTLNVDLSYSQAKSNFKVIETTAGLKAGDGTTTVDISLDPSGLFYNYDFGADLSDPNALVIRGVAAWGGGQDGYYKDFNINDTIKSWRVNAVRSFDSGMFSSIDFGLNVSDRTKYKTDYEAQLCLVACAAGGTDTAPFPGTTIPFGVGGIGSIAMYDADAAFKSGIWKLKSSPVDWYAPKAWSVDEKVSTFYFQANIDTELFGRPLRGNAGFQYVKSSQSGEGLVTVVGVPTGASIDYGDSYSKFLPSLNLSWEFLPETNLRFATARQAARPPMDTMRGGMDINICDTCATPIWTGSGGNPRLRPWEAKAYDLSLEKYFRTALGNRGYVSAAVFYKNMLSYIWNQPVNFDFSGFPLPASIPGKNTPTTSIGQMNQPANGENGMIRGTEFTASVPLDLLWKPLNGLGIFASYSDTESSIHPNGPDSEGPMPGLSKYVSNISAYYERAGFSLRYNRRTRSDFLGGYRNFAGDLASEMNRADIVKDVQVSYSFGSGMLNGLSLYLQVNNIGDQPSATYVSQGPAKYYEYGRTALAGFSYKF